MFASALVLFCFSEELGRFIVPLIRSEVRLVRWSSIQKVEPKIMTQLTIIINVLHILNGGTNGETGRNCRKPISRELVHARDNEGATRTRATETRIKSR